MSGEQGVGDASRARVEACRDRIFAVMREANEQGGADPGEVVRAATLALIGVTLGSCGAITGDDKCVAIAAQCARAIAGELLRHERILQRELAARN